MGLLDNTDDPTMALAMGLLGSGGYSRMPVSTGQGLAAGYGAYQDAKRQQQAQAMQQLQMQGMQESLAQARSMHPLQLQQIQSQIAQQDLQRQVAANLPKIIDGLRGVGAPTSAPYQDQVTPEQVGSTGVPKVNFSGTPDSYFKMASAIQDPTEKRSAIEAGMRQWPQYRPNVQTAGGDATSRDPATTLGAYAAMMGTAGLKGGDEVLKFVGMMQPRALKEGSTYQNPLSGAREYMPKMDVGMRPTQNGGIEAVPGVMDFLRQKTQATVDPVAAGRFQYETGMVVGGQGQGGSANGYQAFSMAPKDRASVQTEAFKGGNEDWLKNSYRPVLDSAKSADNMLSGVQALRSIDINTGWGTEAKATAANVLAGLGIAPKNAELFAANSQKFQSQAMTRLWEVLNNAKGPQTEGDATRAKATFAQLSNTPEANQFILDLAEANARRDKLRAAFYSEAMPVARESGDMTAVDRKWQQIQRSVWDDPIMSKWVKK